MLLQKRGIPFEEREVGRLDAESRARLHVETGGLRTFPMIKVDDRWIGGMRELLELDRRGELEQLASG
jgi:glutaredoxin